MTSSPHIFLMSSVVLAAGLLSVVGHAQTQTGTAPKNGIWQTGDANLSRSNSAATDPAAAAPASRNSTDASSWSAGRSSFGMQNTNYGTTAGTGTRPSNAVTPSYGSSSWTAGRGSFGSTPQQNGAWSNKAGLARSAVSGVAIRPANGPYTPSASRNVTGEHSRFNFAPRSSPSAHASPPSLAGAHTGNGSPHVGTLSTTSKSSHSSTSRRIGAKSVSNGLRSHIGPQGRGRTSLGAGTKPSRLGSTPGAPSNSMPTVGDSTNGVSGGDGASQAPQQ